MRERVRDKVSDESLNAANQEVINSEYGQFESQAEKFSFIVVIQMVPPKIWDQRTSMVETVFKEYWLSKNVEDRQSPDTS